jgi:Rad9
MDVVLSAASVKLFSSAIACFSRIAGGSGTVGSSDIYLEFDPITGLEIRTMNDAKTAYACMTYQPNFFLYCSTPSDHILDDTQSDTRSSDPSSSAFSQRSATEMKRTLTCRIALKALIPIVRYRKNVDTVRIRSCALTQHDTSSDDDRVVGLEFIFTFRNEDANNESSSHMRRHPTHHHNNSGEPQIAEHQRRAIHRVHVVDSTVVSVVLPTDHTLPPSSELVVAPMVLLRLLKPLQRTVEVALIVRSGRRNALNEEEDDATLMTNSHHEGIGSVSVSSFHHSDTIQNEDPANGGESDLPNNNAILQATTASLLKTETACTAEEFVEFDFISDRRLANAVDTPETVNEEVVLVFSIKEAKSMLQLCSTLSQHQELLVHLSFHWGGKPMKLQTQTDTYTIQLVLATLDYQLLTSLRTTAVASDR